MISVIEPGLGLPTIVQSVLARKGPQRYRVREVVCEPSLSVTAIGDIFRSVVSFMGPTNNEIFLGAIRKLALAGEKAGFTVAAHSRHVQQSCYLGSNEARQTSHDQTEWTRG